MLHVRQWLPGVVAIVVWASGTARAQEALDDILKKATLTPADRATLEADVSQRLKGVFGATGGPTINNARERLVKPAKGKDASKAGLEAYVEFASGELQQYVGGNDVNAGLTAVATLEELDHPKTADVLVGGLSSKYPGVRYVTTRALAALRPKIKDDPAISASVIAALGRAGAVEHDEQVLRRIYSALNFKAAGADGKLEGKIAAGLNEVLSARARQLASGSHDEFKDEEGILTAAACYAGAPGGEQAAMMDSLFTILNSAVNHYLDPGTAAESLPAIGRLAQKLERSIYDMIRASKASPPGKSVSELFKTAPTDRQKLGKEARAGMEELRGVLRGDPWKLP